MKNKILLSALSLFTFTSVFHSQETKVEETPVSAPVEVIDRLNIPGPLNFYENEYILTWSKQNSATWAQQQYILRDDDFNNYKELINLSYFDKEIDIETAVKQKVEYVEKRKERTQDKYSFVNVTESPDGKEIVVDYLVTVVPKEGESYAEYNIDRFKNFDAGGKKSFLIFSYSKRLVGDLKYASKSLSKERSRLMEAIITMAIPPITYKPTAVEAKK
ncbi:hypothetical protein [Epilithonimonas xixisoli]|uniref:Uncharacterized protein n=1 Tax=Epilithonimonas xixisoli TaxID=1476462 RepID=A0A4R8IIA7_9FLAO|nr:hypothetical protein [Epilithonimonas xixisoli]TDX86615.1 hypothetical protein B0I22_0752 [Epilithonimonas xixisoli]